MEAVKDKAWPSLYFILLLLHLGQALYLTASKLLFFYLMLLWGWEFNIKYKKDNSCPAPTALDRKEDTKIHESDEDNRIETKGQAISFIFSYYLAWPSLLPIFIT